MTAKEKKKEKEWQDYFRSDEFATKMNKATEDMENGRYESFDNIDDLITYLDSLVPRP